jgi:hypothetical protein
LDQRAIQLKNVDFELDFRNVVTRFHIKKKADESEFGVVIKDCLGDYNNSYFRNSWVEFISRQTNEFVHILARVATFKANFHIFVDISTCIINIIDNEML